jgi:hypothetical protein
MKLKRLKDEYVNVRKEQHELVECRFKLEYYSQMNNQTIHSIQTVSFKGNHFFVNEFFLGN